MSEKKKIIDQDGKEYDLSFGIIEAGHIFHESSVLEQASQKLSQTLARQEENLLQEHFGNKAFISFNKEKISCNIFPNGDKVYSFDGVEILIFKHLQYGTTIKDGKTLFYANFPYQVLGKVPDKIKNMEIPPNAWGRA